MSFGPVLRFALVAPPVVVVACYFLLALSHPTRHSPQVIWFGIALAFAILVEGIAALLATFLLLRFPHTRSWQNLVCAAMGVAALAPVAWVFLAAQGVFGG